MNPHSIAKFLLGGAAFVAVQFLPSIAGASTVANEAFLTGLDPSAGQYTSGAVLGTQNPTVAGFTDAWLQNAAGGTVQASSLSTSYSSTDYATPTGGSLLLSDGNRTSRLFDGSVTSLVSTASTDTVYLSFLASFGGNAGFNYSSLELGGDGNDNTKALSVGILNATGIGFQVNNNAATNAFISSPTVVANQTYMFLVKIDFSTLAFSDAVTLWVDPTLGGVGDPTGGISTSGFDLRDISRLQVANFSGSASTYDEVRIGTSLADVTSLVAVPEPSTLGLVVAAAGMGVVLLNRRRRQN